MDESKNITIKAGSECFEISKEHRALKADAIYKLLKYNRGDKYIVKSVNEKNLDRPVLDFFFVLFKEITDYLNGLSDNGDYTEVEGDEENNQSNYVPFDEEVPF